MTIAEQLRHEGYERAMKEVGNIQENLQSLLGKDGSAYQKAEYPG